MYLLFGALFLLCILFFILNLCRRKYIIKKVASMCMNEKCSILNQLIAPFGYCYLPSQDIFSTRLDAWQKNFGYQAFYDKAASRFRMIFDALPIYFDYQGKTWLIEVWKGQYGINTGCEVGVYYADHILDKEDYSAALFHAVKEIDMPRISIQLYKQETLLAHLSADHWWLTAFDIGRFSNPCELTLQVSLTLQSTGMAASFAKGLIQTGFSRKDIYLCNETAAFLLPASSCACQEKKPLRIRLAQWSNRLWCRIFLFLTRPFCLSIDRILYLYYYLPFAFRKTLHLRNFKKYHKH